MEIEQLPQIIKDFMSAANKPDPEAYVACFSEEALVVDEGQDWLGKAAIKQWSDKHHFEPNVTLEPRSFTQHGENIAVLCKIDGDYDKTGLPDPLLLTFHFKTQGGKIAKLTIK
ncbi:nuclear transport factor 2 family protein [Paenibacillus physcomitrellae]|uniref:SnoaL-like domain-containing protein n=1 Tax=Paenibacillus physcomitrellae TaxID=1619311 RepID=A0ABQ1FNN6_9BACL|nr:nuclear transport factor 2 family protein [Paenibacillus physcomitrellae]GGA24237.1 hypothetical protein GCM10010917_06340 [Paenibacillus physcomitrellae]